MRHRIAIAVAAAIFLVLAGTGAGNALWSSPASVSSSAAAGTHAVELTGVDALTHTYTSSALTDTAAVLVRNTGTVSAPFTLAVTSTASTLASGAVVRTWASASATCATTTPSTATSSNWTNVPAITGTLAGGASQYYCVRASLTVDQQRTLAGQTTTLTARLTSQLGTAWTATAGPLTATQTVADDAAPTTPGRPVAANTTGYSTDLTWAASTDNVGVTSYEVYRNNVRVATVTTAQYTDETLRQNTTYSYTVYALDAAGNRSAVSAATSVTTIPVAPSTFYRVAGVGSSKCVSGTGGSLASNTQLVIIPCTTATTQSWAFVPTSGGYYAVVGYSNADPVWTVQTTSTDDGVRAVIRNWSGTTAQNGSTTQQWRITRNANGEYIFTARSSGKCFDVQNNSTGDNTPIQQYTCNGTTAQSWRLTAVN